MSFCDNTSPKTTTMMATTPRIVFCRTSSAPPPRRVKAGVINISLWRCMCVVRQ